MNRIMTIVICMTIVIYMRIAIYMRFDIYLIARRLVARCDKKLTNVAIGRDGTSSFEQMAIAYQ